MQKRSENRYIFQHIFLPSGFHGIGGASLGTQKKIMRVGNGTSHGDYRRRLCWPNITITSDGQRVVLAAEPTVSRPEEPLRYLSNAVSVIQAKEFDNSIDLFVQQVLARLNASEIRDTNLEQIWNDLISERADAKATLFRKFEALLGYDPGEADELVVKRLIETAEA